MQVLLVVATPMEAADLQRQFAFEQEKDWLVAHIEEHSIYLLSTGIGMTSTAYMLGRFLALREVDLAINFGIAGSFDRNLALGDVVEIVADSFAGLGAEDGEQWLDLSDLGFPQFRTAQQAFFNHFPNPVPSGFSLPQVKAITVNRTHGKEASIEKVQTYFEASVESMEGAAFFHAMTRANVPFWAFRSISNYVEKRDRDKWDIPLAVKNIQAFMMEKIAFLLGDEK